ncbi:hypothetical protein V6N13_140910 [Hibiscus sabdariffa]|uniref:Uncharacterized protein n=1 Tax=Hibiscus sabdariffa TaxID=183260 RepID=A0ABR2Q1H6_9ROSI
MYLSKERSKEGSHQGPKNRQGCGCKAGLWAWCRSWCFATQGGRHWGGAGAKWGGGRGGSRGGGAGRHDFAHGGGGDDDDSASDLLHVHGVNGGTCLSLVLKNFVLLLAFCCYVNVSCRSAALWTPRALHSPYKTPLSPTPEFQSKQTSSYKAPKDTKFPRLLLSSFSEMAQVSMLKAFLLALVMAALTVASAQVSEAPSPSPDAGAGFAVGVSTAAVGFSLIVSLLAFLRH